MSTPTDASDELKIIEEMIDKKGSTPIAIGKGNKSSLEGWSLDSASRQTPVLGFEVGKASTSNEKTKPSTSFEKGGASASTPGTSLEDASRSVGAKKEKGVPPPGFVKPPKPKLTKAERRALQEKQREDKRQALIAAGKLAPTSATGPGSGGEKKGAGGERKVASNTPQTGTSPATTAARKRSTSTTGGSTHALPMDDDPSEPAGKPKASQSKASTPMHMQYDDEKKRARAAKKKIVPMELAKKQVTLFGHLPQYEKDISVSAVVGFNHGEIHSAILRVGLKYADGAITGSNARCVAMLTAFKQVIQDYVTPPSKSLHRDLETRIKPMIQFLIDCRPLSISMGNAINYLKQKIISTANMSEPEAKSFLLESIDSFIQERILLADKLISQYAVAKINDGDVILTHSSSRVVEESLKRAYDEGKKFRVVVVDSRPLLEGRSLLNRLVKHGLECTYVLINAISYIMKEVSKVFIGAYTLLANGNVISRVGTAVVAMMAHAQNVPVIVCCETYKFCERVQLDSICFNELGNPNDLVNGDQDPLKDWQSNDNLKLLNLYYDLTPMHFVMLVITEVGMIPPTSVPVVLREYRREPSLS